MSASFPEGLLMSNNFEKALRFLNEVEKLKMVYRQNMVVDGSRYENSAEHSWHIALMAIVLSDFSDNKNIDLLRVIKMLLIHDIVEIDTGDIFLYDVAANQNKLENESESAKRIFGLLPEEIRDEFLALWNEFEKRETPDALFAAALDGMQPLMNHYASQGKGIERHNIKSSQVISKKKYIEQASKTMWEYSLEIIKKMEALGYIKSA
jgi:putative hydrolase of HD superfamily